MLFYFIKEYNVEDADENKKTSSFLRKSEQFSYMRIWSSFRLEEIINNLKMKLTLIQKFIQAKKYYLRNF